VLLLPACLPASRYIDRGIHGGKKMREKENGIGTEREDMVKKRERKEGRR